MVKNAHHSRNIRSEHRPLVGASVLQLARGVRPRLCKWIMVMRIITSLGKLLGVYLFPNMFESNTFIKSTYSSFACLWIILTRIMTVLRNRRGGWKWWSRSNGFTEFFLKMTSFSFHTSPCTRGNHIYYSRGGVREGQIWNEEDRVGKLIISRCRVCRRTIWSPFMMMEVMTVASTPQCGQHYGASIPCISL